MDVEKDPVSTESGKAPSESPQETEQDSDGIWSITSENKSYAESDLISTDSVSHELLTVRDKTALIQEGSSNILQLISDAESLALERSQSKPVPDFAQEVVDSSPSEKRSAVSSPNEKRSLNIPTSVHSTSKEKIPVNGTAFAQQPSIEDDDSGYSKSNIVNEVPTFSTPIHYQAECSKPQYEELQQGLQNINLRQVQNFDQHGAYPLDQGPSLVRVQEHHPLNRTWQSTPKLISKTNHAWKEEIDHDEEKISVTKDVKEVCNSSIKEGHETRETGPPIQKMHLTLSPLPCSSFHSPNAEYKKISSVVHDDCSNLLQLALNSASSFGGAIRLLRQMVTLQFGVDTPRVAESLLQEIRECEETHQSLQSKLSPITAQLQSTYGQVQTLESCYLKLQQDYTAVEKTAANILHGVEETLASCGLHHMIAVTSPRRRSVGRILEDAESALTLLLGELSRKTAHCKNLENELQSQELEREGMQKSLLETEKRLLATKRELESIKEWSNSEISMLKHCLGQAEANSAEIRVEKVHISESYEKEMEEKKRTIKRIQKQLLEAQHSLDSRTIKLESSLQEMTKEKISLEATLVELQNKLCVQEQQMNLFNEENTLLVAGLRSTIKHQQLECEKLRLQLDLQLAEKQNASRRSEDLANELTKEQEAHQQLQTEASQLMNEIRNMKQENQEVELSLQGKVDNLIAVRCDLERQMRARDFTILQLQTELRMDGQRINALTEDNKNLLQKTQTLQERIWEATRRRRHGSGSSSRSSEDHFSVCGTPLGKRSGSENGSVLSLLGGSVEGCPANQKVKSLEKDISNGQSREEHLHKLLVEKDEFIKNLQNSLSTELTEKNKELEMLRQKLPELEEQMGSLLTAIEVNEAMGQVTTEVGRRLQERQEHLKNLDRSSSLLQDEYSSLAMENQALKAELSVCKKNSSEYISESSESARRAKEEARQERLNAVRLQEQCTKLQAQLHCMNTTLEQERRERAMKDMVQQFKHEDFGAVLDSTHSSFMDLPK